MITRRQEQVIKLILEHEHGVRGEQLASILSVSSRTIRTEIREINCMFNDEMIICSNKRNGYYIQENQTDQFKNVLLCQQHTIHKEDRIYRMLGYLLFDDEIIILDLAEQLELSLQTTKKELTRLQKFLKNAYPFECIEIDTHSVKIIGDEVNIRKVLFQIVKNIIQNGESDIQCSLCLMLHVGYQKSEFEHVIEVVEETLAESEICLTRNNLMLLSTTIYVSMIRNQYGHFVDNRNAMRTKEAYIHILSTISEKLDDLNEHDFELLSNIMYTFKMSNSTSNFAIDDFSRVVLDEFCNDVFDKYSLNLKASMDTYDSLLNHVEYMLRRIEQGYELKNPIITEIKKRYPFAYEVSMLIAHIVYKYRNNYILDDEISFIAIYIEHFLESKNIKINAFVVSPQRSSINNIVLKWLHANFANQINIVKVIEQVDTKMIEDNSIDLLISVLERQLYPKIPSFHFANLPNIRDINRLHDVVHTIMLKRRFFDVRSKYFDEHLIQIFDTPTSFEQAICTLSNMLEDSDRITDAKAFGEDVIMREKNYPTTMGESFMIPHPLFTFAKKTSVAVGVLNEPLHMDNNQIQLIFLLAIEEKYEEDVNLLFHFFKQLSSCKELVHNLIDAQDAKSFREILLDVSLVHKEPQKGRTF